MDKATEIVNGIFETCSRKRSCQCTPEPLRTTAFNAKPATHSFKSNYVYSISTSFNKRRNLVREQGVGGSNPLSPTIKINSLQARRSDPLVLAKGL